MPNLHIEYVGAKILLSQGDKVITYEGVDILSFTV